MTTRASLSRDLSDIQRRLRAIAAQNDRMHEWLAMRIHHDTVVQETGSAANGGERDARYEARLRR